MEETIPWEESKLDNYELVNQEKYDVNPGIIYSGQMRLESSLRKAEKLIPHGKGTMTADDGSVSEGLYRDG